ncbi:MAG TPA: membrane protein insertase YidC [Geobacteraceae bacterium]
MEKRVLIAVVLSIAVMYGYSFLVPQSQRKPVTTPNQGQMSARGGAAALSPQAVTPVTATAAQSAPAPENVAERDIVVDTDLYSAVFSSRGAALKSFVLKKYRASAAPQAPPIALVAAATPASYTLRTAAQGLPLSPDTLFSVSGADGHVAAGETRALTFTAVSGGLTYKKVYTLNGSGYAIDLEQQLANAGPAPVSGTLQLVLKNHVEAKPTDNRFETHDAVTLSEEGVKTVPLKDLAKGAKSFDKGIFWSGFADKYFFSAVIAEKASIAGVNVKESGGFVDSTISSPAITLNPGQSVNLATKLYFGPKDLDILKSQGHRLEEVIDFGWFSAIAKPLLYTLKFFYRYLHNYGLAIIIITIILKIFFFPLTHKSYKSMKEMQKLQPKMTALREKYKDDRDGLNRAVMELYKEHKVNPLGGCLPMVVQIPVFFALYKALMFSIELRQAPFMFWITDLSAKDPYYITPIIMGVTMVIQQKMTPSTGMDPTQAKMMMALPVVFTFMFLNFPSGLVLYWLVNNILTIAQQYYINKKIS